MNDVAILENKAVMSGGVPRAVIPLLPEFELTSPPECPPSREDFLIAEIERRFGGRAVWLKPQEQVADPESYKPAELQEPEWTGGFRGQVAKLLWEHGLQEVDKKKKRKWQSKAIRFLNCGEKARPGVCKRYPLEHKYFVPHGCEVDFCKKCGDELRSAMTLDYCEVVSAAIESQGGIPEGWVLARVTFTLRSDGREITPVQAKEFNRCVGDVVRRAVGSRKGFGLMFQDEVGFETRGHLPDAQRVTHGLNLHAHGLYFGPRLENRPTCVACGSFAKRLEKRVDVWKCPKCGPVIEVQCGQLTQMYMAETEKTFGEPSHGVFLTALLSRGENKGALWILRKICKCVAQHHPGVTRKEFERLAVVHAVRWAVNHMFKYLSKPPAVTADRLGFLIAAFHTAKRFHSLGLFYGKKPEREKKDCPCPKCKVMGIVSTVEFEGRQLPNGSCAPRLEKIEELLGKGYIPLRVAGRDAVLAMGGSGERGCNRSAAKNRFAARRLCRGVAPRCGSEPERHHNEGG